MERFDLVLNLHGEVPGPLVSDSISREEAFLPELKRLHEKFPRLRCVLEASRFPVLGTHDYTDTMQHCSTAAALDAVRACGPSVAGSFFYSYSRFQIPSLPYSPSTFAALLLKHMVLAGSITAHHLYLTGDISQADPLAYCKPIPQTPLDRDALIRAVCSGDPKFFLQVAPPPS